MTDTSAPAPKPLPKSAIRIKHIRFTSKGMIIASPKEAEDALSARESDKKPVGYDIYLVPERNAFRLDRYDGGAFRVTKWIPASNVHNYEDWDQPNIPVAS